MGLRGLNHFEFKLKVKEIHKLLKFKHFNSGYKYPNTLNAQLRLKRSFLNCHLHPITLACKCGKPLETVKHLLIYDEARLQLFTKLEGLLLMRVRKYTKTNLCELLLSGEKPHIPDKYYHKKFIFYIV